MAEFWKTANAAVGSMITVMIRGRGWDVRFCYRRCHSIQLYSVLALVSKYIELAGNDGNVVRIYMSSDPLDMHVVCILL